MKNRKVKSLLRVTLLLLITSGVVMCSGWDSPGDLGLTVMDVRVDNSVHCRLNVSWDYCCVNDGYQIWRRDSPDSGAFNLKAEMRGNGYADYAANDPSLKVGVTYCYKIRAILRTGDRIEYSHFSEVACAEKG